MATYSSLRYDMTIPNASTSAQVGAGAMKLIKTIDSDGSDATISFVDGASDVVLDNTYQTYIFDLIGIHPESDDAYLKFQCSTDGGSNYNLTLLKVAKTIRDRSQLILKRKIKLILKNKELIRSKKLNYKSLFLKKIKFNSDKYFLNEIDWLLNYCKKNYKLTVK